MPIDVSQFRGMFFEEARDYVAAFESAVLRLEADPGDQAALQEMFRAAHSLKGCSATLGITDVAAFTHILENLLDPMREGAVEVTRDLIELLLAAGDMLGELLECARENRDAPPTMDRLAAQLEVPLSGFAGTLTAESRPGRDIQCENAPLTYAVRVRCASNLLTDGLDPLPLLRELHDVAHVESVSADITRVPTLDTIDPESCYLGWSLVACTSGGAEAIHEVFEFVEDTCRVEVEAAPAAESELTDEPAAELIRRTAGLEHGVGETATLRVATARIDEMINLVGELVIAQASLAQTASDPEAEDTVAESIERMGRRLHELQQCALSVRTIPLSTVFLRFPRLVRDIAADLGKQVQLDVIGGDTELDKSVIEGLSAPLTHLLRNAVDHGLELAEERVAIGKPACGTITIAARQEHGSVVIEIRDDGRGLDTARILDHARSRGLVGPTEQVSDERLHSLIFEPGFSTAESVSDVSGRGVGMDAAREAIEALSGTVHVRSERGVGTWVRITLPLTLAILDGFALDVAGQTYIVPLLSVLEVVQPKREDYAFVLGRGELVTVRGEVLRLVRLRDVLGHPPAVDPSIGLVVVVEVLEERYGFVVDDLKGQTNVVIKSLDESVKTSPAVLGGAIQGDGTIALILDLTGVVRVHLADSRTPVGAASGMENGPTA